jgi:DNA-binding response OmpR family regulator
VKGLALHLDCVASNSQRDTRPAPPPPVILIVEDDEDFRAQLAAVLRQEGYAVRKAATAEEAVRALGEEPLPSLVTLDLGLPTMSGEDFLALKNQYYRWAQIPVVVISGCISERGALRARVALQKPVEWEQLIDVINACCPIVGRGDPEGGEPP